MVSVQVLLDTGPTQAEAARVCRAFARHGMDAAVQGHSYGGPPPVSAFTIVVSTQLPHFLDLFSERPGDLHALVGALLELRADPGQWGKPHGARLEDTSSGLAVHCDPGLPAPAYAALLGLDLTSFDRGSPPLAVQWHPDLARWQACLLNTGRRLVRRIPTRQEAESAGARVRRLQDEETTALRDMSERAHHSAVTRHRAAVVLHSAAGWSTGSLAKNLVVSEMRARATIRDFNAAGLAALAVDFPATIPGPTPQEAHDARDIARQPPARYGRQEHGWEPAGFADFLVAEGIVDDITPSAARTLLAPAPNGEPT